MKIKESYKKQYLNTDFDKLFSDKTLSDLIIYGEKEINLSSPLPPSPGDRLNISELEFIKNEGQKTSFAKLNKYKEYQDKCSEDVMPVISNILGISKQQIKNEERSKNKETSNSQKAN